MNKKIYKGYELVKAIEDGEIKEGTILIFTSTISKDNKKEVEVVRRPEGLILFKKDAAEILPTSWLFNSKIEVLEDNTEEIILTEKIFVPMELNLTDYDKNLINNCFESQNALINQLVRAVNKLRKEKSNDK